MMKKIPTLFERVYENHRVVGVLDKAYPGMECVFDGTALATEKFDGSCCAIINGEFYKRYDAKKGKTPPAGAILCCEPDPITGHHPHWVKVSASNPADKWFWEARKNVGANLPDATYEAVGPHFQGNPYKLEYDTLVRHSSFLVPLLKHERTFEGIKKYLKENYIEGIVFWFNDEPVCKIKRTDFGFEWPPKEGLGMTDREKLRELIGKVQDEGVSYVDCFSDEDKPEHIGNYELADYLAEHGVTFATDTNVGGKWISVEDRLPTEEDANPNESVLAIAKADGFARCWCWDIVERYHQEFTHWMPLPVPPKAGETNDG